MPLKVTALNQAAKHGVVMARFARAARKILKTLGLKNGDLSVLLTSDKNIRKINRKFLKHDYATDVISFGSNKPSFSGEIVISLDTAASNCKEYGNTFSYETLFYLCHGILHIMGYDDDSVKKRNTMLKKQAQVLKRAGLEKLKLTK